jgi:hypothetical protein
MRHRISLFLIVILCSISLCATGQQTLGSVNGTVLDASGAAVPGTTVTVTDADINVTRTAKTQADGYFQIFNLPIGTYKVTATHDGFDTTALTGIPVREAAATTVPVTLKVGQTSESIDVTASPLLNATDNTNGYTLDSTQIATLPLGATGSFTQAAILSPGVNAELLANLDSNAGIGNQPIWANGQRDTSNTFQVNGVDATNLFNGKSSSGANSQRYAFNIGQSSAIGGAAGVGTSVYGSNGNSLPSPPPEFIQELRVNTSMYDAQQGATAGAQIDVNTLSGTNVLHGQAYGSFANSDLNAAPFFFKQQALLHSNLGIGSFPSALGNPYLQRWTAGGTAGGPIKKDKLFFFAAYQYRDNRDDGTGLSQLYVPATLLGDRSAAGIAKAYSSYSGSPYTGTISPIALALLNATVPGGGYLIPSSQNTSPYVYGAPNVTLFGTSTLIAKQAAAALDYDVSRTDRLSVKYYYQTDPVTKSYTYSQTLGFPAQQANGSQVLALDNTIQFGSRLNWEQRLGYDLMNSYSFYNQTVTPDPTLGPTFGVGAGSVGLTPNLLPGLDLQRFASTQQSSSAGLDVGPYSAFVNLGYYQNRLNPSTNVIYSLGKHTLVVGGGYSYTQLNIENNRPGLAEVKTKNLQTFLAGTAQSSNVLQSVSNGHNLADRYYRSNEFDAYLQDKWQARSNLSITAGVRLDDHGGLTEKYGNIFNFNPSLYNVNGSVASGFQVNNSGFVVAGNNAYDPTQGESNSTLNGRQWGISPRVGFAWSPKRDNNALVINGGFGLYYDRGELFTYLSQPAGGSYGGPFGVTESAPLVSYVVGNGTTLADPIGTANVVAGQTHNGTVSNSGYVPPNANPGTIKNQLQNTLGIGPSAAYGYSGQAHPKSGQNCGGIDNQDNYTDCPDALNFGAYDSNNVLPYTMNWNLNLQWQPRNDLAITIGYVGNRGRHSVIPIPFNEPGLATSSNPIHGETASYGFQVLNANNNKVGAYGDDFAPIAVEPWNSEDGGNTDFRVPYIGYSPNAALFETVGTSAYDALQTHIEKRLSHHIAGGVSYTWSHALDEQSDIGLFFTGNNPNNLRSSYASSDFDRTHVFTANFDVQFPNSASQSSFLGYLADNWDLTGIGVVQSGEPYSLYEYYGAVGSAYFGDYPTLLNPILPIKNPQQARTGGVTGNPGSFRNASGFYMPNVNPADIDINYLQPGQKGIPTSTGNDPQDIYETDFAPGNQRNIFRQAAQRRLDVSFRKTFKIKDRYAIRYNFDVYNIFNTTSLDVPQNQAQIRQNNACSTNATASNKGSNNCASDYVNYGQIATTNNAADQLSALQQLDRIPQTSGIGSSTIVPNTIPVGQAWCNAQNATTTNGVSSCSNNGTNFGSVTGTIGGNRAVVMGLHLTY